MAENGVHQRIGANGNMTAAIGIAAGLAAFLLSAAVLRSIGPIDDAPPFVKGLLHPILGLDHLIAMVAVGLLSVQLGGRAIWTVPALFVGVMGAAGVLGLLRAPIPLMENVIAISVIVLGALIAQGGRTTFRMAAAAVIFFAFFHGYAHGLELPWLAEPAPYTAGFMLATAAMHIVGVAIGVLCDAAKDPERLRANIGACAAGVGIHMALVIMGGG